MLIFLDTEFTTFENPELISLALVAENGQELYVELDDFHHKKCSDFVKDVVLPLLSSFRIPSSAAAAKVGDFLSSIEADTITICADYHLDFFLLKKLLARYGTAHKAFDELEVNYDLQRKALAVEVAHPEAAGTAMFKITTVYRSLLNGYFDEYVVDRHHALQDARAIRKAYLGAAKYAQELFT